MIKNKNIKLVMYNMELKKLSDFEWMIEKQGDMNVPAIFFGSRKLISETEEKVFQQAMNVACLPGILKAAMVMPDGHSGYGFPIGGVAAFTEEGVFSVGGVGFDINCGVRTIVTNLTLEDVKPKLRELVNLFFRTVPAGLGSRGEIKLTRAEVDEVLMEGAPWVVERGYGEEEDLMFIEEGGVVPGADPEAVSERAIKREKGQIGTLGSGNHYLEVQYVADVFDEEIARTYGLFKNQVVITFHCGSRGLGHQIGSDYLQILYQASKKYGIKIRDRELVCAPISSPEGQRYFSAVKCGINYAFANRQVISHLVCESLKNLFPDVETRVLYDVGHNTVKEEIHIVDGKKLTLYIHRKGSTRAFGPGHERIPRQYLEVGQPVIIGGSMGTESYILAGTELAMEKTFGSTCHGAGRRMSRTQAKKQFRGETLVKVLEQKGIIVRGHSMPGIAEEAPEAYKDVREVVDSVHALGISRKVVRLVPLGVVKG